MSCNNNKFTILKGSDNTFIFTIKQNNSTLPLTIEDTDTFFADLVSLDDDIYLPITNKLLEVEDPINGKVSLTITALETDNGSGLSLVKDVGSKVDRYYSRPTYKLILKCSTVNNGDFIAKVPEVYVD